MADRLTPSVTDGHKHGRKKLELMTTDSLNAYDFIQLDKIILHPLYAGSLRGDLMVKVKPPAPTLFEMAPTLFNIPPRV